MRPTLHFTANTGWINDPHGITFRDGRYEAFFQYVPGSTAWAPGCHWGHASGPDLVSLAEGPVAIAPGDGDGGIWTGCIVTTEDPADTVAFYTATSEPNFAIGRVRAAYPLDEGWTHWRKGEVVVEAPPGVDLTSFRDPVVRREGEGWRMFLGGEHREGIAMALSWTSPDLRTWTYDGVTLERSRDETDPVWMGALWECPQFVTVDGVEVMISSVWEADVLHYAGYATGTYADGRFDAASWGRLTYGEGYYAPSLFFDADGMPCLVFWIRGISDEAAGWAGAHSVPFRLSVPDGRPDGALIATPHPDVDAHRGPLAADGAVDGLAADIVWDGADGELTVVSAAEVVVSVTRIPDAVVVRIGDATSTVPAAGAVRVILDGPVLELASDAGLYAAAIAPRGADLRVTASAGELAVYPLTAGRSDR